MDGLFGSLGSFFDSEILEGVMEVNPPFDQDLILRTAVYCHSLLERAKAKKQMLTFVVVLPETDSQQLSKFAFLSLEEKGSVV